MPIKYQKWIERSDLQNNPEDVYIFGDNYARQGLGGQAKAMRGRTERPRNRDEENARSQRRRVFLGRQLLHAHVQSVRRIR